MRWLKATLCTLLQLHFFSLLSVDAKECAYFFSEQPPEKLNCSPYAGGELRLECMVQGPDALDVVWLRRAVSETVSAFGAHSHLSGVSQEAAGAVEIIAGSTNTTSVLSQRRTFETGNTVRSQLRIRLTHSSGSNSERASYCCSVVAAGGQQGELAVSDAFVLEGAEAYVGLPPCNSAAQSEHRVKCAVAATSPQHITAASAPPSLSSLPASSLGLRSATAPRTSAGVSFSSNLASSYVAVQLNPSPSTTGPTRHGGGGLQRLASGAIGLLVVAGILCGACLFPAGACVCLHRSRRKKKEQTLHLPSATNHLCANYSGSSEWLSAHSSPAAGPVSLTAEPTSTATTTSSNPYVGETTSLKRKRRSSRRRDVGGGTIFSITGYEDLDRPTGQNSTSDHVALVEGEDREKDEREGEEEVEEREEDFCEPDPEPVYTTVLCSWSITTLPRPPSAVESGPEPIVEPEHIYSRPSPRPHRQYSVYSYDGMYVMPSQILHSDHHRTSSCHHYEEIIDTAENVAYLYSQSVAAKTDATYNQGTSSITPDLESALTSHSACSLPTPSLHPPRPPQLQSLPHPSPDTVGCGRMKKMKLDPKFC